MRGDGFGIYSFLPYTSLRSNLTWGIRNNSALFDINYREAYLGRNIEWLYTISVSLYVTRMNDQPSPGNLTLCLLFYSGRHVDQYRLWIVFVLLRHTGEWRVESIWPSCEEWGPLSIFTRHTLAGEREGGIERVRPPAWLGTGKSVIKISLLVTGGDWWWPDHVASCYCVQLSGKLRNGRSQDIPDPPLLCNRQ